MPPSVQPLLAAIAEASKLEPVLKQVARHFGCDDFSYTVAPRAPVPGREPLHFITSTMAPEWAQAWDRHRYVEIDPRFAHWRRAGTLRFPQLWSHAESIGQSEPLDRFLNDALAHGIGSGVSFAIPDDRVFASVMAWTTTDPELSPARLAVLQQILGDMALFSYYLHAAFCPAVDAALATLANPTLESDFDLAPRQSIAPATTLSHRQRECLALTASGLALMAVAGRMGLTQRGVNAHLAAIRLRLKARTTAEAVATAMRLRIIE